MNLPIPTVGQDSGPQYAQLINDCLTLIDGHTHTPGSGVPITSDAISITSDLTFNGFGLVDVKGLTLSSQVASPGNVTIYTDGTDLFYTDGSGNDIQITDAGGVAGTPGSIANLVSPASATYVSGSQTFVWQSNTGVAANLDGGSLLMRNLSPNSTNALTLSPPAGLSSNYTVTLPSLPAATRVMTITSSGSISATDGGVSTSDLADSSVTTAKIADSNVSTAKIADSNVTTPKIVDGAITQAKRAALGQAIASSSGSFSHSTAVITQVTNQSIAITATGRPVFVGLMPDGNTSLGSYIALFKNSSPSAAGFLYIRRNGTLVALYNLSATDNTGTLAVDQWPSSSIWFIDIPPAGGVGYTFLVSTVSSATIDVSQVKLVAYEL